MTDQTSKISRLSDPDLDDRRVAASRGVRPPTGEPQPKPGATARTMAVGAAIGSGAIAAALLYLNRRETAQKDARRPTAPDTD